MIEEVTVRQAADFYDLSESYGLEPEDLIDFVDEEFNLGQRLFLAVSLPIDEMGIFLLTEEDRLIIDVAKARLAESRKGDRTILLPGE